MIRVAAPADAPAVLDLTVSFFRSVKRTVALPKYSLKKMLTLVDKSIAAGLVLVAVEDGKVVGTMIMSYEAPYWSEEKVLRDLCTYVDAPYRNSTHGRDLLKTARDYAILKEVPLVQTIFTGEDVERKCKLYQRLGFRKMGGVFGVNL
jgi:GNAT superfamily N-acetyltransferase